MGLTKTRNDERRVAETLIYLLLRQGVCSLPDKVYFLATCQKNSVGLVAQKVQPPGIFYFHTVIRFSQSQWAWP